MKKTYIIPTVDTFALSTEENVLLTMSTNDGPGEVEGGMSNQRTASSSIWDED